MPLGKMTIAGKLLKERGEKLFSCLLNAKTVISLK